MITTDEQRERTLEEIQKFREALAGTASLESGKRAEAIRGSYLSMIVDLEWQVAEYDRLQSE